MTEPLLCLGKLTMKARLKLYIRSPLRTVLSEKYTLEIAMPKYSLSARLKSRETQLLIPMMYSKSGWGMAGI